MIPARYRNRLHLSVGRDVTVHVAAGGASESLHGVLVGVYKDSFVLAHAELLGEGASQLVGRQVVPLRNLVWWQEGE